MRYSSSSHRPFANDQVKVAVYAEAAPSPELQNWQSLQLVLGALLLGLAGLVATFAQ
jgi:hypothetical protein